MLIVSRTLHLARLLACVAVLFGTAGAATLDALAHASTGEARQHENGSSPESGGAHCVLCLAAAAPALGSSAVGAFHASAQVRAGVAGAWSTCAPLATSDYLRPHGRGPPAA
jgi:hypothetical protein